MQVKELLFKYKWLIIGILILGFLLFISTPPLKSEPNKRITIEEGETIRAVSKKLKHENIIRSSTYFNVLLMLTGDSVVAGEYLFKEKTNIYVIVRRVAQEIFKFIKIITYNEGMTVAEIAEQTKIYYVKKKFLELATPKSYLFGYL